MLHSSEILARSVMGHMREEQSLIGMGVECLSIFFTSIKATPEMMRALEAEYRESLQKRADQAIYSRRAEAVEQERKIKQGEQIEDNQQAAPGSHKSDRRGLLYQVC